MLIGACLKVYRKIAFCERSFVKTPIASAHTNGAREQIDFSLSALPRAVRACPPNEKAAVGGRFFW